MKSNGRSRTKWGGYDFPALGSIHLYQIVNVNDYSSTWVTQVWSRWTRSNKDVIGAGTTFRLEKFREKKTIKTIKFKISLCNMYFSIYTGVWGNAPRSWGVFENFCVKRTLQYVRLLFSARQHICYNARPSVCPSHGCISQRRLKTERLVSSLTKNYKYLTLC